MHIQRVGILYHPKVQAAKALAKELADSLAADGHTPWVCSAWDDEGTKSNLPGSGLLVGLGGDGTIIRAARAGSTFDVPVLGVNFGRLGFLAELNPDQAVQRICALCKNGGHVEERALLETRVTRGREAGGKAEAMQAPAALNDVVIARGAPSRPIYVDVCVDEERLNVYRADGIIVSTATGSTGYNLSAGGPVLAPTSMEMIITPVTPHVALNNSIVAPESSIILLTVVMDHEAVLSIDGQFEIGLESGDSVEVRISPKKARFYRIKPRGNFFGSLMTRLRWGEESLP